MSCYFRQLKDVFAEAGIEVNSSNRKQVDQAIHRIVETDYKDCPAAWRKIKQQLADDEKRRDFIDKLKNAHALKV